MAIEITIPRLGWSMEEGILVNWLKRDGDFVARGDLLFVLESDKAAQEIESLDEGILHIPPDAAKPGDTVAVGQVIGVLLSKGEAPPSKSGDVASGANGAAANTRPAAAPQSAPAAGGPAARRQARKLNQQAASAANGAGAHTAVSSTPVAQAAPVAATPIQSISSQTQTAVTPRARRVAGELGVELQGLAGTGRGGRVRERDVRAAAERGIAPRVVANNGAKPVATSNIRRTIARRMAASRQTTAAVTLTSRADATTLLNVRAQFAAAAASGALDLVPSFTDLIAKLAAAALAEHPQMNARWEDEQIIEQPEIHIGVAVDTEAGLLVPVIRNVPQLRVREITALTKDMVARARAGALTGAELQGGTFTITNLGMYGIDAFTPIINPPETAILGLGAIRREAVFEGEKLVPSDLLTLSLTFDHRVVDGAPAARFLQSLVRAIEHAAAFLA